MRCGKSHFISTFYDNIENTKIISLRAADSRIRVCSKIYKRFQQLIKTVYGFEYFSICHQL